MKKSSSIARRRARSERVGPKRAAGLRSATTYRLDARYQRGLALLGKIRRMPLNRMVNEAVGEYLESRTAAVQADLEETLRRVRAYRDKDPDFERAIAEFADAEAKFSRKDPIEGRAAPSVGPAQSQVRDLIRG